MCVGVFSNSESSGGVANLLFSLLLDTGINRSKATIEEGVSIEEIDCVEVGYSDTPGSDYDLTEHSLRGLCSLSLTISTL
jgi:hypothetical protein